jgi:hypothetical protein
LTPGARSRTLRYRCSAPIGTDHEPPGENGRVGDEGDDGGVPHEGGLMDKWEEESAYKEVGLASLNVEGVVGEGVNNWGLRGPCDRAD